VIKKPVTLKLKGKKTVGDMFLPISDGVISHISSYNSLKMKKGVIDGEVAYKVGDTVEAKRQYTSCSGWVQISGKNESEVLERMLNVYNDFYIKTK
jgi:hypothetical protein